MQILNTAMTPSLGSVKFQAGMERRTLLQRLAATTMLATDVASWRLLTAAVADEKPKMQTIQATGKLSQNWVITLTPF